MGCTITVPNNQFIGCTYLKVNGELGIDKGRGSDGSLGGWWSCGELVSARSGGGCEIVKFFSFAEIYFLFFFFYCKMKNYFALINCPFLIFSTESNPPSSSRLQLKNKKIKFK